MKLTRYFLLITLLVTTPCFAQDEPDSLASEALNVFLDCDRCDNRYIRTEITFVNYVRDRTEAQVHLLITTERTGSGGLEYTLNFIGREDFTGVTDTLRYASSNTDTRDERREGLVQVIKLGLVRYVAKTPMADQLSISLDASRPQAQQEPADDKWNYWVFRVGFNGSFNGEESRKFYRVGGNLNANRVTEDWKIRLSLNGNYRESNFDVGDETITSTTRNGNFWGLLVKSLSDHWSVGGSVFANTSSFNNTGLSVSVSPALEFNLFPYSESTRREFRFLYELSLRAFEYEEVTIFDKTSEFLLQHSLEAELEVQQPWGDASASLEASQYLHDFEEHRLDLYQIELSGFVNFRLVRGFSVFAHGNVSFIRDQLFLPKEEAAEEDILLQTRRLPTSYEYGISLGLNYTFGSIYNNVVNSRFGF
ncbi:MAG: hypothetical protein ACE5G0_11365 [Rhodothermales bacterium]